MAGKSRSRRARIAAALRSFFAGLTDSSVTDQVDRFHDRMHPAQNYRGRHMGGTGGGF
ncbi:hypothetical protein [Ruania halotolerans]|uniref:hypothetical protein n=1 Tax=Ruania halotolerans TaxID=2897773 RepID=UPI001E299207|nr:hypothetical protein [Ruania halotolerans]UFU05791.1 hypothetical protein LQF10_15330 [Ruania halotolerans]